MNEVIINKLDPIKTPLIQKLYKQYYPSGKVKKNEDVYVAYLQKTIIAVVRLRRIDQWRLVTGMLVVPQYRKQNVAHQLLKYCREHVFGTNDYCFAYEHLESLYKQHGFVTTSTNCVPAQVRSLFERYQRAGKKLCLMKYE